MTRPDLVTASRHQRQTCNLYLHTREGRGQEAGRSSCQDSLARLVRQISLHLLSDLSISRSLDLSLENKLRFQPVGILSGLSLTRVVLVLDCLKNKHFHCKNLQEVNCQTYQSFHFPSDSKEEGTTTHWVLSCNCWELYWYFKLNCQSHWQPRKECCHFDWTDGPSSSPFQPSRSTLCHLVCQEIK